ncbi:hypothetical protein ASE75_06165 [Sphingomonas sp. Leaf17]|uniref:hypothetical protein n=1 Tax=Sphingomonas sp. Leaf17 TaxID=1735683 RepID=UPI0006F4EF04|nr:hypothetical protein [Sphingomonas sp. Leaf17]KQM65811.1 hypothetical protein ASE75_06165 [Sphingomonas sp. Leaf17]
MTALSAADVAAALRGGVRIAPSDQSPWVGIPIAGQPFTREQVAAVTASGREPSTVARMQVELRQPTGEGDGYIPRIVQVACPRLARTKARTRALIITPSGEQRWVNADPSLP